MRFNFILILSLLFSCSSDELQKQRLPEVELKEALTKLKDDDLQEAKNDLYAITIRYAGTETAETAQFYLGETHTKMGKHLLAANSYRIVYERYKGSKYVERSQFREAKAFETLSPSTALDQEYTKEAIQKYTDFIADHPNSDKRAEAEHSIYLMRNKLAVKLYESAVIYYKIEKWRSSLKYIKLVKQRFENAPILLDTYLLQVKVYIGKEEWVQAEQELEVTKNKFPEAITKHEEYAEILEEIAEGKANQLNG